MKKGLFCAVLIVVSLVAGWCIADIGKYCSKTVASNCTGQVGAISPKGFFVFCNLKDSTKYVCKDGTNLPPLWWCIDHRCKGTVAGFPEQKCSDAGSKGCKTPMWD